MAKRLLVSLIGLLLLTLSAACSSAPVTTSSAELAEPSQQEGAVGQEEPTEPSPEEDVGGEEPAEAEPVTISYFTFSAAPDHLEDLDEMIRIFEEAHPGINVEVETAPFDEYFTKLQTLIAGGTPPDVFELNYENFVSFAARDVLLDLTQSAEADASFDPTIFYQRAYDAFNMNDRQFGLPATFSTVVLFYNKDLFDEAGFEYPTNDWTWSDAVTAAEQLTDTEAGVWGLYSGIQFWEFYKKAAQNNCSFFNEDKTEVLINAPECVEALETMISFVDEHGVMPSDAEMGGLSDGDLFTAGKLAMDTTGIWQFSAFEGAPFEWDIVVEPGMAEKATHFFANAVAVSSATEHPEAAWEWVKFFTTSPEVASIRVETGWELPALNNPAYFEDYLAQSPPDNRQAVFDSLEYAIVPPVIERQNEMQDTVNGLLDQVKLGQLTPQEALDQAKAQIEALLQ